MSPDGGQATGLECILELERPRTTTTTTTRASASADDGADRESEHPHTVTPAKSSRRGKRGAPAATAEQLFDRVAPRYDLTNAALSFGLHGSWQRATVAALAPRDGERVLDLCAGTLHLSEGIVARAPGATVVAADRSRGMLARGVAMRPVAAPVQGCALDLPFKEKSFDAACVGYGLRNVPVRERAVAELRRVLRPGGRLAILEFVSPRGALARLAHVVGVRFVVPFVGGLVGSDPFSYRYLARSIEDFLDLESLAALVEKAGFRVVVKRLLPPRGPAALILAEALP